MSTHATIAAVQDDGRVKAIYLHYRLGGSFDVLREHYNNESRVRELMALGDLSSLAESPDAPEGHSFANQVEGHCVAYGRDRGESNQQARVYQDLAALDRESGEYLYYWDSQRWTTL